MVGIAVLEVTTTNIPMTRMDKWMGIQGSMLEGEA
jgi:hypothetical protein